MKKALGNSLGVRGRKVRDRPPPISSICDSEGARAFTEMSWGAYSSKPTWRDAIWEAEREAFWVFHLIR